MMNESMRDKLRYADEFGCRLGKIWLLKYWALA